MASLFERIRNGIRVKPNNSRRNDTGIDADDKLLSDILNPENAYALLDNISQFRELSGNRNEMYDAFDEMEKDARISAALSIYADDATQTDLNGNVVWIKSDDPDIAAFGNRLLRVLKINQNAWSHIYQLCKYGNCYLELFYDDELDGEDMVDNEVPGSGMTSVKTHKTGSRIAEYVEQVCNPASIFELTQRGKTAGYIRLQDDDQNASMSNRVYSMNLTGTDQEILPADKFVHIMLAPNSERFPETFEILTGSGDNKKQTVYRVANGKSLIENTFRTHRELQLMEDSLLLNRVTRSAITRILQIEVGDMPKTKVREKIRALKMMIEQKNFMDVNSGDFANQASPGPIDNIVYTVTRNGAGAITSTTLGGDVDVKSLADIEHVEQKEAGQLGIPLAYIKGTSGDGGGLSSGTALTKLDNKHARKIKRIQTAYREGITTLINIFALRKGLLNYINNFTVEMVSPSTIEDDDRDQQLDNRITMVNNLLEILSGSEDAYSPETLKEVTEYLVSVFLNRPEIVDILIKDNKQSESEETDSSSYDAQLQTSRGTSNAGYESSSENDEFMADLSDMELPDLGDSEMTASAEEDTGTTDNDFGDFEDFA